MGSKIITSLLIAGIAVCLGIIAARGWPEMLRDEDELAAEQLRARLASRLLFERQAEIHVLAVDEDHETGATQTRLRWRERRVRGDRPDPFGPPIELVIEGRQPRFEALVMTFRRDGEEDPLSGQSLVLFRRAYGEHTAPEDGFSFADPVDPVPDVYRVAGADDEAQRRLWTRFWHLATDPAAARAEGIDVVQAKAVSTVVQPGKVYRVTADATGRLDIEGPLDP